MNEQLRDFLGDFIKLIQEKHNATLIVPVDESAEERSFRSGSNFAYYDVLDLVESQLSAYGFDLSNFDKISPVLGEKI